MYSTPISGNVPQKTNKTFNYSSCLNRSQMSVWSDMFTSFLPKHNSNDDNPNQNSQNGITTVLCMTVAILLSVTILVLLSQIYFIFQPCLKSLLWALLLGSAIYRFKAQLCLRLQIWLDSLILSDYSLLTGLIRLPFDSIGNTYHDLVKFISENKILFILFHFRVQLWKVTYLVSSMSITVLQYNDGIIRFSVIVAFTVQIIFLLSRYFTTILSFQFLPTIILLLIFYLLQFLSIFGLLLQTIVVSIFLLGLIKTASDFLYGSTNSKTSTEIVQELKQVISLLNNSVKNLLKNILSKMIRGENQTVESQDLHDSKTRSSQTYFKLLFTLTGFMISEQLGLSNIVLVIYCCHFFILILLKTLYDKSKQCFSDSFEFFTNVLTKISSFAYGMSRNDIFFQIWSFFFLKGDRSIQKSIQARLDLIASAGIICAISLAGIFFTIFLSVMIYGEFYSVANLAQNEISKIDFIRNRINLTFIEYTNRDYLNGLIKNHITGKLNLKQDDQKQLNEMLLDFGKNLFALFNSNPSINNDFNSTAADNDNEHYSFIQNFQVLKSIFSQKYIVRELKNFNFQNFLNFINSKTNSLMPLIKAFGSIVYALIFLILDSSSIVLGFILNFIIFVLALFYLLLTSRNKYRPMEILDGILGCSVQSDTSTSPSQYMGEVVNSIFAATLKLSLFYGIYTWLLHSLFELKICFIPAVVAAILGAVPILHAYWASFPTVLYIYWFDPFWPIMKSIGFASLAIAPSFFVDSSIYSDIKRSGHPYLTGLAITCGIVYYGFEGALFGPLWLCFLFIILHLCTLLSNNYSAQQAPEVFEDARE